MRRNKKVLIIALLATVVLVGSIGGIAIVQAAEGTTTANVTQPKTLLARVAENLGIDQTKLEAAVTKANKDMQLEALKTRLKNLVANGKITQVQADDYLKWYQSKPDTAPFQKQLKDWQQAKPTQPPDLKNWQQSQPKLPQTPVPGGQGRGMMNGRGNIGRGGMMNGQGNIGRGGMMGGPALPQGTIQ